VNIVIRVYIPSCLRRNAYLPILINSNHYENIMNAILEEIVEFEPEDGENDYYC